jgi:uncharacterized protein (DUF433 family)
VKRVYKPGIGLGAYSVPDIALILGKSQSNVRRLINDVWDERLGRELFGDGFSITIDGQKFVNFHVFIELLVYLELRKLKVSAQRIIKTRNTMRKDLDTEHPFAMAKVLAHSKKIWYEFEDSIVDANGTRQTNFERMVQDYAKKIDFDSADLAERYWPLGKHRQVVVDPLHQFGMPTIAGTNINTHTIRSMYLSGESPEILSGLFNIPLSAVQDALDLHGREAPAKAA